MVVTQFVVIGHLLALLRCIDKEDIIVLLVLLEHHDTGGDTRTKEQVIRQLDNSIHIVVINQVFANLLLGSTTIHHTREADDSRCTIGSEPME